MDVCRGTICNATKDITVLPRVFTVEYPVNEKSE